MDFDGSSDQYCLAYFDREKKRDLVKTDTHWRSNSGTGSFNWRLKLPLKRRMKKALLTIEVMDRDLIGSDDLLGFVDFDITPMLEDVKLTGRAMGMSKKYFKEHFENALKNSEDNEMHSDIRFEDNDKFWLPLAKKGEDGKALGGPGEVLISLQILTKEEADKNPQGEGRQQPNHDPHLPEPEGRLKMTLNPIEQFKQLVPP